VPEIVEIRPRALRVIVTSALGKPIICPPPTGTCNVPLYLKEPPACGTRLPSSKVRRSPGVAVSVGGWFALFSWDANAAYGPTVDVVSTKVTLEFVFAFRNWASAGDVKVTALPTSAAPAVTVASGPRLERHAWPFLTPSAVLSRNGTEL
jgi:hypothetical protein